MFECFVRSHDLFVCHSLHKLTSMDVGFHFNFGLGWEGRELVSGSLLLVIWGGLLFYNFLWDWGGLLWNSFSNFIYVFFFFTFFLNIFKLFFHFFFLLLFCGGTLLIFVQHSLIHSHNFFVYCGEV